MGHVAYNLSSYWWKYDIATPPLTYNLPCTSPYVRDLIYVNYPGIEITSLTFA